MGHRAWGIISLDRSRVFPNPEIPLTPFLRGGQEQSKFLLTRGGQEYSCVPFIKGDLGGSRLDYKLDLLWV
jgi:hypothetical protein